ncbi:MAG: bifunctional adenosylcobinamide kinase/adenosylcobinamide-phosphate guanylyltransferase [Tissierellia bacterium]|nr:bifunctional adenosylcobinamide kinase/adenosylcobinamide-phosphate guanylyltransferase [Tissierellia bacterium]
MIYLITGGARSGKSTFAESLFNEKNDVVYIATSRVSDEEMQERVNLHRDSRPSQWRTFEGNYNLVEAVGDEQNYILDCITVLSSNIMYDISKDVEFVNYDMQKEIEDTITGEIESLIDKVKEKDGNLIIVTNEVGSSTVPDNHITRVFRDIQGRVNQRIALITDSVYLVCCGIPVRIK